MKMWGVLNKVWEIMIHLREVALKSIKFDLYFVGKRIKYFAYIWEV